MATKDPFSEQHPFWKPKLTFAFIVFTTGSFALFFGKVGGGEWVAVSTLVLTVFTAGSVTENKALLDSQQ